MQTLFPHCSLIKISNCDPNSGVADVIHLKVVLSDCLDSDQITVHQWILDVLHIGHGDTIDIIILSKKGNDVML